MVTDEKTGINTVIRGDAPSASAELQTNSRLSGGPPNVAERMGFTEEEKKRKEREEEREEKDKLDLSHDHTLESALDYEEFIRPKGMQVPLVRSMYDRVVMLTNRDSDYVMSDGQAVSPDDATEALRPTIRVRANYSFPSFYMSAPPSFQLYMRGGVSGLATELFTQNYEDRKFMLSSCPLFILREERYLFSTPRVLTPTGDQVLTMAQAEFSRALLTATSNNIPRPQSNLMKLYPLTAPYLDIMVAQRTSAVSILVRILITFIHILGSGSAKVSYASDMYVPEIFHGYTNWGYMAGTYLSNAKVTLIPGTDVFSNPLQYADNILTKRTSDTGIIYAYKGWLQATWFTVLMYCLIPCPYVFIQKAINQYMELVQVDAFGGTTRFTENSGAVTPMQMSFKYGGLSNLYIILLDATHEDIQLTDGTMISSRVSSTDFSNVFPYFKASVGFPADFFLQAFSDAWSYVVTSCSNAEEVDHAMRIVAPFATAYFPMGTMVVPTQFRPDLQINNSARALGFCSKQTSSDKASIWDSGSNEISNNVGSSLSLACGRQTFSRYWIAKTTTSSKLESNVLNDVVGTIPTIDTTAFNLRVAEMFSQTIPGLKVPPTLSLLTTVRRTIRFSQGLAAFMDLSFWILSYPMSCLAPKRELTDYTRDLNNAREAMLEKFAQCDTTGAMAFAISVPYYSSFGQAPYYPSEAHQFTALAVAQRLPYPMIQYYMGLKTDAFPSAEYYVSLRGGISPCLYHDGSGIVTFNRPGYVGPTVEQAISQNQVYEDWYWLTNFSFDFSTRSCSASAVAALFDPTSQHPILPFVQNTLGACYFGYCLHAAPNLSSVIPLGHNDSIRNLPLINFSMPPMRSLLFRSRDAAAIMATTDSWLPISGPQWPQSHTLVVPRDYTVRLIREHNLAKDHPMILSFFL